MSRKLNIDSIQAAQRLHNEWHGKLEQPMTFEKHFCVYTCEEHPDSFMHNPSCCSNWECILDAWE